MTDVTEAQSKSLHNALIQSFDSFEEPIAMTDTTEGLRIWREAQAACSAKASPYDYNNADTEAERFRQADQAAARIITDALAEQEARIARLDNAISYMLQLRSTICVRYDGTIERELWQCINSAFDKLDAVRAALENTNDKD